MGTRTAAAVSLPARPRVRPSEGMSTASAAIAPSAVSPRMRPAVTPASKIAAPSGAVTRSAPIAGEIPRPPAPRRNGDQLCPVTVAALATVARDGRRRGPARSGPIVPFATSSTPAVMTGPTPATSFRALADTVPMPMSRRSVVLVSRATIWANGMAPAMYDVTTTAAEPAPFAVVTAIESNCKRSRVGPSRTVARRHAQSERWVVWKPGRVGASKYRTVRTAWLATSMHGTAPVPTAEDRSVRCWPQPVRQGWTRRDDAIRRAET
jgi:hypothetical protein